MESEDGLLIYFEAWYTLSAEDREKPTMDFRPSGVDCFFYIARSGSRSRLDNLVFISILAAKLPAFEQTKARYLGLTLPVLHELQHPGRHVYIARKPRCPESVIDFISPGPERISA